MKVRKKEIKQCENSDGTSTLVLDLEYTHKWETGKVLIKDYKEEFYKSYLKEIRKEVTALYISEKLKQEA